MLVADEAHLLAPAQLEELRLLTNGDMDATNPFALLLVGQPMLPRRLKMGLLAALDQRISTRHQFQPLDLAEASSTCVTTSPSPAARPPPSWRRRRVALSGGWRGSSTPDPGGARP